MSELLAYTKKYISDSIKPESKTSKLSSEPPTETKENDLATSSVTTSSTTLNQITPNRKQTLLLEARRARVEWIDNAKSFFISSDSIAKRQKSRLISELNDFDSYMDVLSSCKAGMTLQSMPFIVKNVLYKNLSDDEIEERISRQLSSQISSSDVKSIISSNATKNTNESTNHDLNNTTSATDDENFLETTKIQKLQVQYEALLRKLRSPEYAELIHITKQFVDSLDNKPALFEKKKNDVVKNSSIIIIFLQNDNEEVSEEMNILQERLEVISSSIQSFLKSTIETYQSLLDTNRGENDNKLEENDNKLFEAFVFNQCHQSIYDILQHNKKLSSYDEMFYNKLILLQFLTPSHFEIHHFSSISQEKSDVLLQVPILYLQSITRVASPYYKLQFIFNAYKAILEILAANTQEESTPNADDVIPTFIYTLLRANPKGLITNIYAYEVFSGIQDNLSGEIGYAFTNLIAAIQFLLQVNVRMAGHNDDGDKHNYIHVSLEEHKQFILNLEDEKIKKNHELNVTASGEESCEHVSTAEENKNKENDKSLSVHMVRKARLNTMNEPSQHPNIHTITTTPTITPRTCNYTFLGKQLQDIRVQDVPLLLQEYHTILYAYEELVMELKKKEMDDNRKNRDMQRELLEHNFNVQSGKGADDQEDL